MESPVNQSPARLNFFSRMLDNPIISKELKGRMRGRQGFMTLTIYLLLISFFITMIYLFLYTEGSSIGTPGYLQTVGKVLFSTVVLLELLMISFIAPSLTSGAISSERERQTFDLLHISLLSAPSLIFGKLSSAVVYLLLLIFTAIPIQSLAFFLGGVGAAELIISTLMLVVTAVFFCALGLFFSSFTKRTTVATVLTHGSNMFSYVVFFIFLFMLGMFSSISYSTSHSAIVQDMTTGILWFMFSTNAFFAAVVSEAILIDSQSVFYTTSGFFGTSSFPLLSPWLIYVTFHTFFTTLLILLSIYFVNRTER
jgi:ABC-type transport system involved in multi-copper enzyme maturation permease subunit